MVVERTFGMLKGRWGILQRPLSYKPMRRNAEIATACAILHNICLELGESVDNAVRIDHPHGCIWDSAYQPDGALAFASGAAELSYAREARLALCRHLHRVHG